jgi:hypothetical protein
LSRPVTTTDLWKLVALVFVLVDHTGLFFDPENNWWRLFGRIAAPVFFFFIGFAHTRTVPWSWLAFGAVLTLTDYLTSEGLTDTTINILLNFALLRWLVLPLLERHVLPHPWRLAVFVATCLPLIHYTDNVLEYGTEGWLWALFGLAHRRALDSGEEEAILTRVAVGAAAATAYVLREIHDYAFGGLQSAILIAIVAALALLLARFRRADLAWQPPEPLAGLLRFCGRRSLEIYAVSLFAMQVVAYGIRVSS